MLGYRGEGFGGGVGSFGFPLVWRSFPEIGAGRRDGYEREDYDRYLII